MQTFARWLWYLMPANPIVVRIVQGGSRRMRDLWVRMGYVGALIILVLFGLLSVEGLGSSATLTDLAKAGTRVFAIVAYGQVILVCLLAPLFMAGAIQHERQGETFDILLTTPLTNLQIVLGTLLSRLFFVLVLLLSGLPLFAVLLIFGGVPVASIFVAFAVAALTATFVGSIAVTLSVLRAGGRKAVFVFIIVIAAYLVAVYGADKMMRLSNKASAPVGSVLPTTVLTPLHPLLVLEASFNSTDYRPPAAEEVADRAGLVAFYHSRPLAAFTAITLLSSMLMLLFSATQVRRLGQGMPMLPLPQKLRNFLRLSAPGERTRTARHVWNSPIAWREANARGNRFLGILARWGFIILGIAAAFVLALLHFNQKLPRIAGPTGPSADQAAAFRFILLALLLLELSVIVIVALYMSAGCVSKEREDGTLDLLLTTPVTPQQYVWGKLRGLVSFLSALIAVPVVTMVVVCVYSIIAGDRAKVTHYVGGMNQRYDGPLLYPEMMLLVPLLLVPFVAMCVTVGMTWSIKAKGVVGAVVPSISIIGTVMLVLGFCGMNAVENIPAVGAVINAFSPVTQLIVIVNPVENVADFVSPNNTVTTGRITLFIGGLLAALGYGIMVYVYLTATVKGFDQTVRKLTGTAS